MTYSFTRRARGLALLLAIACLAGSAMSLAGAFSSSTQMTSVGELWNSCLRVALSVALAWAAIVAAAAYRSIGSADTPRRQSTRLLASALIAVAAWSFSGTGSATASTPASVPAVAVATSPGAEPNATLPSPDFGAPATADDNRAPAAPDTPGAQTPAPDWTPTPPRATTPADRTPLLMPSTTAADPDVVVRRGDSLWSIIGRHLGPGASAAEIASWVPAWHVANRAVIGDDPDLLLVGQILSVPASSAPAQGDSK